MKKKKKNKKKKKKKQQQQEEEEEEEGRTKRKVEKQIMYCCVRKKGISRIKRGRVREIALLDLMVKKLLSIIDHLLHSSILEFA
ncbi:hypothetical protein MTR_8g072670 [Medicago truncatula]|uniref:Uncharacterized protein n=1 Tax=Medicago truncatula TaxID=3880 RepID=G7L7Y2_MEDTR|nr:hypothetical protein MTR_8g072670 [Medicago truncatula]